MKKCPLLIPLPLGMARTGGGAPGVADDEAHGLFPGPLRGHLHRCQQLLKSILCLLLHATPKNSNSLFYAFINRQRRNQKRQQVRQTWPVVQKCPHIQMGATAWVL